MRGFFLLFFAIHSAFAWDPLGHMIVGEIAYRQLTPEIRESIDARLAVFNSAHKTDYDFVTAGCWMDDIRSQTRDFNAWHYIDMPVTPRGEQLSDTSKPNVLWAIQLCVDIITGKETYPTIDKEEALVMLLHLVADAHQPLHTTTNNDAGGNRVFIKNLQDPALAVFKTRPNLHFIWDSAYRLKFDDGMVVPAFFVPPQTLDAPIASHRRCLALARLQADMILKEFMPDRSILDPPETWISESHAIGCKSGYESLPGGIDNHSVTLDTVYIKNAHSIARMRLALAGARLAHLLSSLFE